MPIRFCFESLVVKMNSVLPNFGLTMRACQQQQKGICFKQLVMVPSHKGEGKTK